MGSHTIPELPCNSWGLLQFDDFIKWVKAFDGIYKPGFLEAITSRWGRHGREPYLFNRDIQSTTIIIEIRKLLLAEGSIEFAERIIPAIDIEIRSWMDWVRSASLSQHLRSPRYERSSIYRYNKYKRDFEYV